ncbi:MAG: YlxR family protein [Dehalococcoidia bacterium]
MRTTNSAGVRPLPQRTCVGCRRTGDQSSFVRVVRVSTDGGTRVQVDEAARRTAGRGAYLCRDRQCWERGLKGALAASLKATLDAASRAALQTYAERFTATDGESDLVASELAAFSESAKHAHPGEEEGEDS